uniref:SWIM-type domain-containing protein n=1 Tax=Panagrellus redivivus TaxID=6233 RepID=A0A7E4VZS8_PANRE
MPRPKKIPIICPFTATFEQDFRNFLATDITVFGDIARDYCLWAGACEKPSPEGELFIQKPLLPAPYILPASHWLWGVVKTNRRAKLMKKPPTHIMVEMAPSQTRSIRYGRNFHWKDESLASFMDWMSQLLERPQAEVHAMDADHAPAVPIEADIDAIIAALVDELIEAVVQAAAVPPPVIAPVVEVEEVRDVINLDEYLEDEAIEDVVADVQEGDVPFEEDEAMEEVVQAEFVQDIGQPDDVDQDEVVPVEEVAEIGNVEPVQQVVQPDEAPLAPEVAQPVRRRQPPRKAKSASRKAKQAPKKAPKKAPVKRRRRRVPKAQPQPTIQQRARGRGFVAKLMSDNTIRISGTIQNVDWKASSLFKAAHDGEVILRAPPRARFTKIAAGHSHIMMLTSQHHVHIIGSNKFGQLGSSLSRAKLTRAAAQTPGAIFRPMYGMVGLEVKRIMASGHESWAYVGEEQTPYCCGVASDHTWRSSIMESHAVLMRRMREQGQ